jgi:hypothetical protein
MAIVWNWAFEALPDHGETPSYGDDRIREVKEGIRERFNKEHYMDPASGSVANHGYHRMGSAVCYYQAAAPTVRPDGVTALNAQDAGRRWIRTTDNAEFIYTGATWVIVTALVGANNVFSGDNTFTGTNSFTNPLSVETPAANGHAATKLYVDNSISSLLSLTTTTASATFAGTPNFSTTVYIAVPAAVYNSKFWSYFVGIDEDRSSIALFYAQNYDAVNHRIPIRLRAYAGPGGAIYTNFTFYATFHYIA